MQINTIVATIKVNSIKQPIKSNSSFTYTDLKLDIEFDYTRNNEFQKRKEVRDLIINYDYGAVKNSIFNLFNTLPGQKILNPLFGLNLVQYLFQPLNEITANQIGTKILEGISTFEPRVVLQNINVVVDEANSQYLITLIISVPSIRTDSSFSISGILSNSGFNFVNK